jgi:hypothetical protein
MRLLTRWWFAAILVCALVLAWALTLAPWAPWHERTVAEVRLDLHAPADQPQTATSSPFVVRDERAVVTVSAGRLPVSPALGSAFLGSADWALRGADGGASAPPSGNAAFTGASPAPVQTTVGGKEGGVQPLGDLAGARARLTVTGVASAPAAIVVRMTQSRDQVAGVSITLVLVVVCVVIVGIPATTARRRRSDPVIFPPSHEHY